MDKILTAKPYLFNKRVIVRMNTKSVCLVCLKNFCVCKKKR